MSKSNLGQVPLNDVVSTSEVGISWVKCQISDLQVERNPGWPLQDDVYLASVHPQRKCSLDFIHQTEEEKQHLGAGTLNILFYGIFILRNTS